MKKVFSLVFYTKEEHEQMVAMSKHPIFKEFVFKKLDRFYTKVNFKDFNEELKEKMLLEDKRYNDCIFYKLKDDVDTNSLEYIKAHTTYDPTAEPDEHIGD